MCSYIYPWVFDDITKLKKEWKLDEALNKVNWILCSDPTNEDALFEVADILYIKWDITWAEKPIDFILKNNNLDPMWFYVKWVLEMEKTNWVKAKKYLKISLDNLNDENPEIMRCYWLSEYWSWNRQKWLIYLTNAFHVSDQSDAEILYNLIELNLLEHNYVKAEQYIQYYNKNRDKLSYFDKEIDFYDAKLVVFTNFILSIKNAEEKLKNKITEKKTNKNLKKKYTKKS